MKTEINNENKARFISLYTPYGEVWKTSNQSDELQVPIKDICLKLKPLSSISDKDSASVCRLFSSYFPDDSIASVQGRILVTEYIKKTSNLTAYDWLLALDYLRSKSYALPWMGLSVEEMVESGWIKLV